MIIDKRPIKFNYSTNRQAIKYIVVHDTGNPNAGADALAHYRYFNSGNRKASAHYFVDDKSVVETVENARTSWHCGDGRGRFGIYNVNSIGVELCINAGSDWEKTKANALDLIRFLCQAYNIPKSRVVRHYDASRKICPRKMSKNNWAEWWIFREMI